MVSCPSSGTSITGRNHSNLRPLRNPERTYQNSLRRIDVHKTHMACDHSKIMDHLCACRYIISWLAQTLMTLSSNENDLFKIEPVRPPVRPRQKGTPPVLHMKLSAVPKGSKSHQPRFAMMTLLKRTFAIE
eukprot:4414912-Amphidinium_carterae.3